MPLPHALCPIPALPRGPIPALPRVRHNLAKINFILRSCRGLLPSGKPQKGHGMAAIGILVGVIGGLNAAVIGYTLIGLSFGMSLLLYPLIGVPSAILAIVLLWAHRKTRGALLRFASSQSRMADQIQPGTPRQDTARVKIRPAVRQPARRVPQASAKAAKTATVAVFPTP